jgi:transposase InsO family protein
MMGLLALFLGAMRACLVSRSDLVLENLLRRQQLAVALRPRSRPCLRSRDKLFWVLIRRLRADWRRHLHLVRPETVIRWHRRGWQLLWRWRSRTRLGRPRLSAGVRALIASMSRENPLWGAERIRGELLKLGLSVSNRSVRRYRWRGRPRSPSPTWRAFLANHRPRLWAADFFVAHTLTFKALYVLFFIAHGRRELAHFAVTSHPTAAWAWRRFIEATPWGTSPRYLIRDRDAAYGADSRERARRLGAETILTPIWAPRANAIAQRMVGTFRREFLDHLVAVNERHLRSVLGEFVRYYNRDRPHRALRLETPHARARTATGTVRVRPILGGLHHDYGRAA